MHKLVFLYQKGWGWRNRGVGGGKEEMGVWKIPPPKLEMLNFNLFIRTSWWVPAEVLPEGDKETGLTGLLPAGLPAGLVL